VVLKQRRVGERDLVSKTRRGKQWGRKTIQVR